MTRFADELRGSEGERCVVFELDGEQHDGTIEEWDDERQIATVRCDDGDRVHVSHALVELIGGETS